MNINSFKKYGFVYILINPSLQQDMLKIGMTTRSPEERATEISRGTGVATPFFVAYKVYSSNCEVLERLVHQKLDSYRYNNKREFFKIDLYLAIEILHSESKKIEDLYIDLELTLTHINKILKVEYTRVSSFKFKIVAMNTEI